MDLQRNLVFYLRSHGWEASREPGPAGRLWDHPAMRLSVAVPNEIREGSLDWHTVAARLAEVERTSVDQLETAVKLLSTDVANIRAANDIVIGDTIPYEAAVTMMQSAWRMFRTCATTSMRVRPQIRSNYNRRADEIADTARMAHTQRGSFIIPLLLPLSEIPRSEDGVLFEAAPEPVERRVMRTFAEALTKVDELVVKPDRLATQDDVMELVFSGVTAEFASSLHQVLMEQAVAQFGATFEWAPLGGKAPEGVSSVSIPAGAAERVEVVARRLRKHTPKRETEVLTGPIISVTRYPSGGGMVIVDTIRNARSAHVGVRVTTDDRFDEALDWMKRRSTVLIEGRITRESGVLSTDRDNGIQLLSDRHLPEG